MNQQPTQSRADQALAQAVERHGAVCRVVVSGTKGSTPREVGAEMLVWSDGQSGTIGGGRLEYDAAAKARAMLAGGAAPCRRVYALGPALGQCCGGVVTVSFSPVAAEGTSHTRDTSELAQTTPLWLYGAGHVGRAIVDVLAPLPQFAITWVDTGLERFPDPVPLGVCALPTARPELAMRSAPAQAHHLIVTYSHDLDFALCHTALGQPFASCGVIGSATKWVRFRKRLGELGHEDAQISRIACPIGEPELGKHPQAIAVGVAGRLLKRQLHKESALSAIPTETRGIGAA